MDKNFWHRRWEKNEIGFHQAEANALLVAHFEKLSLAKGSRVFFPLCGKTRDIAWLLTQGYRVVGAELSERAVEQLFTELDVVPTIAEVDQVRRYSAENIDILVGDIFDISRNTPGPIDATYDRAALVALPQEMRNRYTAHLLDITEKAPQLLICFLYDQQLMDGPPFSVSDAEVRRHYQDSYDITLVASVDVPGGLKGKLPAQERAWLLQTDE